MNLNPMVRLYGVLTATRKTERLAVNAAVRLSEASPDAVAEREVALKLAKLKHQSTARMIRSLDRNLGQVLDLLV